MLGVKIVGDIVTRKCACCKGVVEIDRNNIVDVLYFQDKYYHSKCFISMAEEKAASKRGKPQVWKDALSDIWVLEAETKKMLEHYFARDELNAWLLENYDITMVPSRFWQVVADLEIGKYKGSRCKPIGVSDLCECWKWGQVNLNKININNKMSHKGPENDADRLRYDLAILITKYPLFLKHKSKVSAAAASEKAERVQLKINYGVLEKNKNSNDENDILDLIDEMF